MPKSDREIFWKYVSVPGNDRGGAYRTGNCVVTVRRRLLGRIQHLESSIRILHVGGKDETRSGTRIN